MRSRLSLRRSSHPMSALVCGLYVHKESTYATILSPDGEIVTQRRTPNEEAPGFLRPHGVERVAMEASTSIAPLHRRLVGEGYDVTVSHPRKTRYIAEARTKSDRVDSRALAELLRLNSLPESYMPRPTSPCSGRRSAEGPSSSGSGPSSR